MSASANQRVNGTTVSGSHQEADEVFRFLGHTNKFIQTSLPRRHPDILDLYGILKELECGKPTMFFWMQKVLIHSQ